MVDIQVKSDEPNEITYAAMAASEKDEDIYGPFDNISDLIDALNFQKNSISEL